MPQATTNRTRLKLAQEDTYNTAPAGAAFQTLRYTSSSLTPAPQSTESAEIIPGRQVIDTIQTGVEIAGDVGVEFSQRTHDALLAGALFNTWDRTPEITNVTSVAGSGVYTVASGGTAFVEGMVVKASGFGVAANNGIGVVTASTSTTVTVSGITTATEADAPAASRLKVIGFQGGTGDITATTSGLAATTLDFTDFGLAPGMWVKIGKQLKATDSVTAFDFSAAALNGYARISAVAAGALDFDEKPAGWTTNSGTGKTIRVYIPDTLVNGTLQQSYSLERSFDDVDQHDLFTGLLVGQMQMQLQAAGVATGSFSFIGAAASEMTSTEYADDAAAITATPVLNTVSNVAVIREGGAPVSDPNFVTNVQISLNNNLRGLPAIGVLGNAAVNAGVCQVTGTLATYFGNATVYNKVVNSTETSLTVALRGSDGGALLVDLPRVKLTSGSPPIQGTNQDVVVECQLQALRHPTLLYTIAVNSFEGIGA